ncbi:hypothetical protein BJ508DRAFT_327999 [Ascobolus immersus RN42]|uniref:Uncharacterized protein n=1 Tax=Ascobolus immersus RN42 TaxID=1160509 RepID=A0A3N4IDC0_ASCIM|nr:hypothetical protein BJ508DRAFT_327999 [Ascobolus immersus RN42]
MCTEKQKETTLYVLDRKSPTEWKKEVWCMGKDREVYAIRTEAEHILKYEATGARLGDAQFLDKLKATVKSEALEALADVSFHQSIETSIRTEVANALKPILDDIRVEVHDAIEPAMKSLHQDLQIRLLNHADAANDRVVNRISKIIGHELEKGYIHQSELLRLELAARDARGGRVKADAGFVLVAAILALVMAGWSLLVTIKASKKDRSNKGAKRATEAVTVEAATSRASGAKKVSFVLPKDTQTTHGSPDMKAQA